MVAELRLLTIACALGWLAPGVQAQAVAPTVFEVDGACAGAPKGSGFLAQGLPGVRGVVLVTALHVVHRCGVLRFYRSRCEVGAAADLERPAFTRTADDSMFVWRELDLVALPVAPHELTSEDHAAQLSAATPQVPARARLIVEGVTALNACAEGEGMARYTTSVQQLVAHVERRTNYSREDVVGTLADPVRLLVSWSTAQPGVSGGPILDAGSKQLLAMNTGGDPQGRSAWAVLLGADALAQYTPNQTHVGVTISDAARPSPFTQVSSDDFARHEHSIAERPMAGAFAGSGALVSDLNGARAATTAMLLVEAYGRVLQWGALLLGTSIGVHAALLGTYGRFTQTFETLLGQPAESDRRLGYLGVGLEVGPELRVLQQSWPRLALSGFVRVVGNLYLGLPSTLDDRELSAVFGVRLRACFNVSKLVGLCVDPTFTVGHHASMTIRYGEIASVLPRRWVPALGAGLGIEYAL